MKLLKPVWCNHDDKPIFSIDVHQECLKFATGGQGLDSGRVVIWNLLPVLSEKAENDKSIPKMLCQMDNHLACVNCVRWSQNGQMLASGSDDKLVMIWRKAKGSTGVFGTGGIQKNAETWKCAATLRGHSGDVLDLAWSPQDRWLASGSVDNTIIIWDVQSFPAMVTVLKGHTGLVKGVTWDPVGKFLASQSDDRSVKIWKTNDWTCSTTITAPFEECGGTTHILRLSWSPDGQYLVSAHALNNGGPTAQIIERRGWKCDKDFVGHRKAVTCVRFHNSILQYKNNNKQQFCCLAVGARDRSLSVWMTALQRPLVVIHELFNDSILDLSWGSEKYILMACSGDGTVACLQFNENLLGTPLTEEEKHGIYQRVYGTFGTLENGSGGIADYLIENPELLNFPKEKIKPPKLPPIENIDTNYTTTTTTTTMTTTEFEQNSNNRKSNNQQPTLPANGLLNSFMHEQHQQQQQQQQHQHQLQHQQHMQQQQQQQQQTVPNATTSQITPKKQLETRMPDGKRRITPFFIPPNQNDDVSSSSAGGGCDSGVVTTTTSSTTIIHQTTGNCISNNAAVDDNNQVAIITNNENTQSNNSHDNRPTIQPVITEAEQIRLDSRLIKSTAPTIGLVQPLKSSQETVKSFPRSNRQHLNATASTTMPATSASGKGTERYQATTSGPKVPITATSKLEFQKTALDLRVHVHNGAIQTVAGLLAKVTGYDMTLGEKLWEIFVGSPLVNLNFCRRYVVLCSLDGTLRLLNMQTGSPRWPAIALTSASIQCSFCPNGKLFGVVTECGILRIWNIEMECVTLATTCHEIFGKFGTVLQFTLTEHGVPLLLFSNGNSYSYSSKLQSWLVLNTKDPIMRHGLQTTMPKEFQKSYRYYPLITVQAAMNNYSAVGNALELNTNNWQAAGNVSFIQNQIKLCEAINSPEELKHWYGMLAFQLAVSGTEHQLRLLLNDLLGTSSRGNDDDNDDGSGSFMADKRKVLNISKHTLLEIVLDVLKFDLKWQRIYMEYNELYESIKTRRKKRLLSLNDSDDIDNGELRTDKSVQQLAICEKETENHTKMAKNSSNDADLVVARRKSQENPTENSNDAMDTT